MINAAAIPVQIIPQSATDLFDARLPSAFFIANANNMAQARAILTKQLAQGWRFVWPGFFNSNNLINTSKTIPNLAIGNWIIIEGKTFRIATAPEAVALAALPTQHYLPVEDAAFVNEFDGMDFSLYGALIAPATPQNPNDYIRGIPPQQLPINYFNDSHARWAGACIRYAERLPRCANVLARLFDINPVALAVDVKLYGAQYRHYNTYSVVTLNNAVITPNDLIQINNALGTNIRRSALQANSTVANTIPLKKLLEALRVYRSGIPTVDANGVQHDHANPWLVQINVYGVPTSFLLSANNNQPQDQLMVSGPDANNPGVGNTFTGNAYPYWIQHPQRNTDVTAHAYTVLNSTVGALLPPAPANLNNLIQFLACTQIVEAHCNTRVSPTAGAHDIQPLSRVPGSGKQARNILRQHLAAGAGGANLPLAPAFNAHVANVRFFQMAGNGGTGATRTEINALVNSRNTCAPSVDMSDDSDVEIRP